MIIMGAPGSGKGTQAARLAKHYSIPTISTGQLFRQHMEAHTELGELARSYIDAGNLVPDAVTVQMVKGRLRQPDVAGGFILDGFPRTLVQAEELERILVDTPLTAAVELWVDIEEVVARLAARALIEGRSDDNEDAIRRRIEVYRAHTRPLLDFYGERGLLREINAVGDIDKVYSRILAELGN